MTEEHRKYLCRLLPRRKVEVSPVGCEIGTLLEFVDINTEDSEHKTSRNPQVLPDEFTHGISDGVQCAQQ